MAQMTQYTLNALKGWPSMHAVDYHSKLADSVDRDVVRPGTVVHLNAAGEYELGVGTQPVMPLFVFPSANAADVRNYGGDPATEKGIWVPVTPSEQIMALVASGAYELVSTQFVNGTYEPNDPLTAALSGADAGKLAVGTIGTDMIVGLVSRGVVDNGYGYDAVAFWPCPIFPQ